MGRFPVMVCVLLCLVNGIYSSTSSSGATNSTAPTTPGSSGATNSTAPTTPGSSGATNSPAPTTHALAKIPSTTATPALKVGDKCKIPGDDSCGKGLKCLSNSTCAESGGVNETCNTTFANTCKAGLKCKATAPSSFSCTAKIAGDNCTTSEVDSCGKTLKCLQTKTCGSGSGHLQSLFSPLELLFAAAVIPLLNLASQTL